MIPILSETELRELEERMDGGLTAEDAPRLLVTLLHTRLQLRRAREALHAPVRICGELAASLEVLRSRLPDR